VNGRREVYCPKHGGTSRGIASSRASAGKQRILSKRNSRHLLMRCPLQRREVSRLRSPVRSAFPGARCGRRPETSRPQGSTSPGTAETAPGPAACDSAKAISREIRRVDRSA
jgi:hypothetical protein